MKKTVYTSFITVIFFCYIFLTSKEFMIDSFAYDGTIVIDVTSLGANGTDKNADDVAIQKALDTEHNGKLLEIHIPEGTYYISKQLNIYSNTKLVLTKNTVIVKDFTVPYGNMISNMSELKQENGGYTGSENITIDGGVWDGNFSQDAGKGEFNNFYFGHANNVTIKNAIIKNNNSAHLIELNSTANSFIENCELFGYTGDDGVKEAIQLDIAIKGNNENGGAGNAEGLIPYDNTPCKNITIRNNKIYNYGSGVGSHSAVENVYHENIVIEGNTFSNLQHVAMRLYHYKNPVIKNNTISTSPLGILVSDKMGSENDFIYPNGDKKPIDLGKTIISDNTIKDIYSSNEVGMLPVGIFIEANEEYIDSVEILNNQMNAEENVTAIYVKRVSNNVIKGNTIVTTGSQAIFVNNNSKNVSVQENNITGNNNTKGVFILNSDVKVESNIIKGGSYGIDLDASKGEVTNNTISNTTNDGIALFNNASGIIKGNTITNVAGNGINIERASGAIEHNTIHITKKAGIRVNKSTSKSSIISNEVTECTTCGILTEASTLSINSNKISNCEASGMYFGASGTYELNQNSINSVKEYGIFTNSNVNINSNSDNIKNTTKHGMFFYNGTTASVKNATIALSGEHGIFAENSPLTVSESVIEKSGKIGIYSKYIQVNILNNLVKESGWDGIYCLDSTGTVMSNEVKGVSGKELAGNGVTVVGEKSNITLSQNAITGVKAKAIAIDSGKANIISLNSLKVTSNIIGNTSNTILANFYGSKHSFSSYVNGILNKSTISYQSPVVKYSVNGLKDNDTIKVCATDTAQNMTYDVVTVVADGLKKVDGIWYYYKDGKINADYTDLVKKDGAWFYVKKGVLNWNYTGLVKKDGVWFYVEKGVLNWNYTGLVKKDGAWFYVEKGVLNWNYTGLVKKDSTWYYVEKGVLNWNYTGLVKKDGAWFYVEKGVLNWNYTGLVEKDGAWFYVERGVLNWNYTGLVKKDGAWFYVGRGVVNFGYTGLANRNGVWYYIEKGVVNFGFSGNVTYNGKVYVVKNGVAIV